MRTILALIIFLFNQNGFCLSQNAYWEDLNSVQQQEVLNKCTSAEILSLFHGNLSLTDNEASELILKELVVNDDSVLLPLYFYMFNNVVVKSDGALAELVGSYCFDILLNYPDYVLKYFLLDVKKNKEKSLMKYYSDFIGYELYFKNDGLSDLKYTYSQVKDILKESVNKHPELESIYVKFWQDVDLVIKNMD